MSNDALIIFVKNPILGKVKTRLAQTVGNDRALEFYKYLLSYTKSVTSSLDIDCFVFYSDFIDKDDLWDGQFKKELQQGDTLGIRMENAFGRIFSLGYKKAIIIGSDCLEITKELIEDSFEELEKVDFVVGPAHDGGYYLLGMHTLHSPLFYDKSWSTSKVFEQSIQDIEKISASYHVLPVLCDIDEVQNLEEINEHILKSINLQL
jgi:uncharacterized protein